jgi:hypothetical protein
MPDLPRSAINDASFVTFREYEAHGDNPPVGHIGGGPWYLITMHPAHHAFFQLPDLNDNRVGT